MSDSKPSDKDLFFSKWKKIDLLELSEKMKLPLSYSLKRDEVAEKVKDYIDSLDVQLDSYEYPELQEYYGSAIIIDDEEDIADRSRTRSRHKNNGGPSVAVKYEDEAYGNNDLPASLENTLSSEPPLSDTQEEQHESEEEDDDQDKADAEDDDEEEEEEDEEYQLDEEEELDEDEDEDEEVQPQKTEDQTQQEEKDVIDNGDELDDSDNDEVSKDHFRFNLHERINDIVNMTYEYNEHVQIYLSNLNIVYRIFAIVECIFVFIGVSHALKGDYQSNFHSNIRNHFADDFTPFLQYYEMPIILLIWSIFYILIPMLIGYYFNFARDIFDLPVDQMVYNLSKLLMIYIIHSDILHITTCNDDNDFFNFLDNLFGRQSCQDRFSYYMKIITMSLGNTPLVFTILSSILTIYVYILYVL